ncbi:AAA family ATPase [Streptomyces sp. NPDC058045]|uniref:AAA family ATPase n=1 Tax=Streptomyces sp. NPDC058045 TaxID=3346311 RepID=UPI0036EB41F6
MRLHTLRVTAFGPFGGTETVDFDALSEAGLFLLHGPTGAGKTSVLDAVCYALYGSVPGERQSGLTLRSDHADPGTRTEVRLDFSIAGQRLEITRQPPWQRPKKRGTGTTVDKAFSALRQYRPDEGEWRQLSRSHQEIGEEIGRLLGMSKEQFCQVVLLPQGDFARFLRADAEARGQLLGRLFDTRRFAAVEQHLAALRKAGEKAVAAEDAALLADAHRMQQAAGDTLELPLPEAAPGDPGLAAAVLAWAAIARGTAREHRAAAHSALTFAEAARTEAEARLADAQETHRLQQRHAEALARATRLDVDREQVQAAERELERSRRAGAVAPALALRDTARQEHRAAAAAAAQARAALPAALADAGTDTLTAAARRATEERGRLDAARRAEHRLTAVREERAALDRQDQADEELRQDTETWLAAWPATEAALQERLDTAQDAATRAEHLTARTGPAEARLDAARRRDRLTEDTAAAHARMLTAREHALGAHEHWLRLKEQRLAGIAAELADRLTDGTPCPVCGAADHPAPARRSAGHIDRAAEDAALDAHTRADTARRTAETAHADLRAALAAATETATDTPTEQLAAELAELRQEQQRFHRTAAGLHAAREAVTAARAEYDRRLAARQDTATRAASRASRRDLLEQEHTQLAAELAEARGDAASVAERAEALGRTAARLTGAAEAVRRDEEAARRLKDADARLADAAYRAGFDTPHQAADALLDDRAHRELQHRLDLWQIEERTVRAVLAEAATSAAAELPPADPDFAAEAAEAAGLRLRRAASAQDAATRRCTELDRLSTRATTAVRASAARRGGHEQVAGLAALTAGTSADNEHRMRLESYVLAARLEQVAAAATARLARMSGGRYTLVHSDDRAGRGRSGLGLHVVDAWTGRERDTTTLSGGETFFASLALALGLADVVTDEAGGVRLDTLFIDEGFGSLDDQTLDEVLDVLDQLRERDRSVGIVSHVADLRRRIHAQLEIVKHRTGSAVRQR